jgi:DHA3 family macrolide efflux protein-like MFS transporter
MNSVWKKNTALFLSSQAFSLLGTMLVQYAITWYITLETKSGIMITISIICGFLPSFFISPFAGVWADRFNRKALIIVSDAFIALSTLALAIIFIAGYKAIWLLFVASAIRSFGSGIQMPSVGAILPQLAPQDKLMKINGVNSSIISGITLVSPLISGALLSFTAIEIIFFIDVVTAAVAIAILILLLHIPVLAKAADGQKTGYFKDIKEGLTYINKHSFVKTIFIFNAIYFVLVSPLSFLTPLQVARSFGDEVWRLSVLEAAFSLGMMAGGLIIAAWGGFKNRLYTMVGSNLIVAFCTFSLGIIPNYIIYAVIVALIGLVLPMFNTPFTALLQEKVEGDFLGRVFGVMNMIACSIMPLSMLLYGPLADIVKIEWMLIVTAILMFVQVIFMAYNKSLIEAGRPADIPLSSTEPI